MRALPPRWPRAALPASRRFPPTGVGCLCSAVSVAFCVPSASSRVRVLADATTANGARPLHGPTGVQSRRPARRRGVSPSRHCLCPRRPPLVQRWSSHEVRLRRRGAASQRQQSAIGDETGRLGHPAQYTTPLEASHTRCPWSSASPPSKTETRSPRWGEQRITSGCKVLRRAPLVACLADAQECTPCGIPKGMSQITTSL